MARSLHRMRISLPARRCRCARSKKFFDFEIGSGLRTAADRPQLLDSLITFETVRIWAPRHGSDTARLPLTFAANAHQQLPYRRWPGDYLLFAEPINAQFAAQLRLALRQLRKSPGFSITVLLTLSSPSAALRLSSATRQQQICFHCVTERV